ncbi:hypothetical protein HPB47_002847 [Ixodes persulcatus]|uniref:Uncharacterized protein n=1 Tax=Ixodes persulcatus TaxID=34615 RepID=A0AC60PK60_IXOPE|nr:hypothetical protein HPB47_002847 [Ixodes persulcatus]
MTTSCLPARTSRAVAAEQGAGTCEARGWVVEEPVAEVSAVGHSAGDASWSSAVDHRCSKKQTGSCSIQAELLGDVHVGLSEVEFWRNPSPKTHLRVERGKTATQRASLPERTRLSFKCFKIGEVTSAEVDLQKQLESIQRKASRTALYLQERRTDKQPYERRLQALRWSRLERRRNLARRVLLYKFLHGDYTIPDGYLQRSGRDPSKLDQRLARTTSASSTIFVQTPALWNSLPANACRAPDVAEFKDLVRNLDLNV